MPAHLGFSRPSPASLLLLGLLGLLLWGQCAFHLNESGSHTPPVADLHLHLAARLVRVDSLPARTPGLLYVTVGLDNQTDQPCRLASLNGTLWLRKQRVGLGYAHLEVGAVLPAHTEQTFSLALTPYKTENADKTPDFGLLRAALQGGKVARHQAGLEFFYSYYPYQGTYREANTRYKTLPFPN